MQLSSQAEARPGDLTMHGDEKYLSSSTVLGAVDTIEVSTDGEHCARRCNDTVVYGSHADRWRLKAESGGRIERTAVSAVGAVRQLKGMRLVAVAWLMSRTADLVVDGRGEVR